jgi:hypothetical protein
MAGGIMEIGLHASTNARLNTTGDIYTITRAGSTINIDRTAGTITVSPGGTVAGFKTKSLATIKTELETFGCTVGAIPSTLDTGVLGECMQDSSGAQSSPYTPQLLIDTTGATGLFKTEIFDAKAVMEAALGTTSYTFATPGGQTSSDVQTAIRNAGLWACRSHYAEPDASWRLANINLYKLAYLGSQSVLGATDEETLRNVRSICAAASQMGIIIAIVGHGSDTISVAQWTLILDTIKHEFPQVNVTSMYDAVNTIKNGGSWTTADAITYTRTWAALSDYRLRADSPCINAGIDVGLTSDFEGNAVPKGPAPDIGAYEYYPRNYPRKKFVQDLLMMGGN